MRPALRAVWTLTTLALLVACPAGDEGASDVTETGTDASSGTETETETETGTETETETETGEDPEPVCGDGVVEEGEQCDDANDVDGDGCDLDCTFTELLAVDAADQNTCVLIEGGRVRCWGESGSGQLGLGTTETIGDDETPAAVADVVLRLVTIGLSLGDSHACALLDEGSVRCWGSGASGRLGLSHVATVGDDESPVQDVLTGGAVVEIDAGGSHTCARLDDDTMRCWGAGFGGALGYGNPDNVGDDEHPVTVDVVPVGVGVVAMATGIGHTCVITAEGAVRCWGAGGSGQLGYGNTDVIGLANTPADVGDASVVPLGVEPGTAATALALGQNISCALFEGGEVLCWGAGFTGALGQGSTDDIGDDELPSTQAPIDLGGPAIGITVGDSHVCALLDGGEARCWGANTAGQLGLASLDNIGDDELPSSIEPLDLGGPIRQIDAGGIHTCAILDETNELYCWGLGSSGQLGYGNTQSIGDDEFPASAGPVQVF